jgi:hypothetical protein
MKRMRTPDAIMCLIKQEVLSGSGIREAARRHGIKESTLTARAWREGWTRKRSLVEHMPNRRIYPAIPTRIIELDRQSSKPSTALPDEPGIYFIWKDGKIAYIGQSISLKNRLVCTLHHILREGYNEVSFLPMREKWRLRFAECYYIGICMPPRNFGNASIRYPFELS